MSAELITVVPALAGDVLIVNPQSNSNVASDAFNGSFNSAEQNATVLLPTTTFVGVNQIFTDLMRSLEAKQKRKAKV